MQKEPPYYEQAEYEEVAGGYADDYNAQQDNFDDFGGPLDLNNPEEADLHDSFSATIDNEEPIGPKKKFQHQRPHGHSVEQVDKN